LGPPPPPSHAPPPGVLAAHLEVAALRLVSCPSAPRSLRPPFTPIANHARCRCTQTSSLAFKIPRSSASRRPQATSRLRLARDLKQRTRALDETHLASDVARLPLPPPGCCCRPRYSRLRFCCSHSHFHRAAHPSGTSNRAPLSPCTPSPKPKP
jgi:hypothetical protein